MSSLSCNHSLIHKPNPNLLEPNGGKPPANQFSAITSKKHSIALGIIQSPSSPVKSAPPSYYTFIVKLIDPRSILINSSHHLHCELTSPLLLHPWSAAPPSCLNQAITLTPSQVLLRTPIHRWSISENSITAVDFKPSPCSALPQTVEPTLSCRASAVHCRATSVLDLKRDRHRRPTSMVSISIFDWGNMLFIPSIDQILVQLKRDLDFLRRRFYRWQSSPFHLCFCRALSLSLLLNNWKLIIKNSIWCLPPSKLSNCQNNSNSGIH